MDERHDSLGEVGRPRSLHSSWHTYLPYPFLRRHFNSSRPSLASASYFSCSYFRKSGRKGSAQAHLVHSFLQRESPSSGSQFLPSMSLDLPQIAPLLRVRYEPYWHLFGVLSGSCLKFLGCELPLKHRPTQCSELGTASHPRLSTATSHLKLVSALAFEAFRQRLARTV